MQRVSLFFGLVFFFSSVAYSANEKSLVHQLNLVRKEVIRTEKDLVQSLKTQKDTKEHILKLRKLLRLQREEQELAAKRIQELSRYVKEMETRKKDLGSRISTQKKELRRFLVQLNQSIERAPKGIPLAKDEKIEAPKRQVLSKMAQLGIRKLEELRADLFDADVLEKKIDLERSELTYFIQESKERESLLKFHKKLQIDLFQNNYQQRVSQLESYQSLKTAEDQVEQLISQFNVRKEFDQLAQEEEKVAQSWGTDGFSQNKGKLLWPVKGKILSRFGRVFDSLTKLYVFKKGIEIETQKDQSVVSVYPGKVVFSGVLPTYGNVLIVDHGKNYYSLMAKLGKKLLNVGDWANAGQKVAEAGAEPLYFEIRSGNVAVNPLKWIAN